MTEGNAMNGTQRSRGQLLKMVAVRLVGAIVALMAMFFLPAGTFNYWEAWVWLAVLFIPMLGMLAYLLKNDPALLERRMRTREREREQSLFVRLSIVVFLLAYLLPGLDHRFGWSDVPTEIVIAADVLVLTGYAMFVLVLRENSYASRVVEVEQGQKVIDTGPYAVVRHPLYLGVTVLYGFTPLALGSYWSIIPTLLIIPLLVMRIANEEQVLQKELPGYTEYMQKVKHRMIPWVW
jgi:protein-S-isoprenylcysteine O-methyltransferase Ste14